MAKRRSALVRGRRSRYWLYQGDNLVILHPYGLTETSVPAAHLLDDDRMSEHYLRLSDKRWIAPAALRELREIAEGART